MTDLNWDDLLAEKKAQREENQDRAKFAAIGDLFSSQNGFENYFTGNLNKNDGALSNLANQVNKNQIDPLEMAKDKMEFDKGQALSKREALESDPMSPLSQATAGMFIKRGLAKPGELDGKSYREIQALFGDAKDYAKSDYESGQRAAAAAQANKYDLGKMSAQQKYETEKQQRGFQNDAALKGVDFGYNNQLQGARLGNAMEMNDADNRTAMLSKVASVSKEKNKYDNLPEDKKILIKDLSGSNAKKSAIANQIESALSGWDKLDDKQKVVQGRQLIKTLNSSEGADAVGSEEAKRLGGMLEFAMGNFTNGNPTQFGRDLDGFKLQATNTAKGIRGAISRNQAQIDGAYGRARQEMGVNEETDRKIQSFMKKNGIESKAQAIAVLKKNGHL